MENVITQLAVGEILDGRYFYIPAYQRGYRWTEKQMGDLLEDLLCFANDKKKENDFYCLQPIIARRITEEGKLREIYKNTDVSLLKEKGVWEIVDGQQRLTSIYLLYKYLLSKKGWDEKTLKEEEDGKELYHLLYETREDSASFLENISLDTLENGQDFNNNIDFYHH